MNFVNSLQAAPVAPSESLRLELAAKVLRDFGELRFRASGGSMLPAIFPGDILLVRREPIASIRPGHIVLASRAGLFYAHRVVRIQNRGAALRLITRGDALRMDDPAVSEDEYLGRVTELTRGRTHRQTIHEPVLASRVIAWVLRRSDFLAASLLRWHSLRLRFAGKSKLTGSANRELAAEFPR
ncbi:MAG: S24/S26 family peptidase [Candidatus Acidiferrales bacterium]